MWRVLAEFFFMIANKVVNLAFTRVSAPVHVLCFQPLILFKKKLSKKHDKMLQFLKKFILLIGCKEEGYESSNRIFLVSHRPISWFRGIGCVISINSDLVLTGLQKQAHSLMLTCFWCWYLYFVEIDNVCSSNWEKIYCWYSQGVTHLVSILFMKSISVRSALSNRCL